MNPMPQKNLTEGSALLKTKNHIRILLVDDNEEEFFLTRAMFNRMSEDYEVEWASDYDEAIACIQQPGRPYDVFLIDYRLGERSGLDLLRAPLVQHSGVPAILITNQTDQDVDIAALQAGAADYLNKGQMEIRLLERTIRYALERASTLRQLRESEARYRAVVEDQIDMIIRFGQDGRLTFVNEAYCRFRQQQASELIGTDYLASVVKEDQDKLNLPADLPSEGDPALSHEVRAITPGKRDAWHQWTTRTITNSSGSIIEYQSVIRDITERKRVEGALNARLEQLRILRRVDVELTEIANIDFVISMALDSAMRLGAADLATMALYDPETGDLQIVRSYGVKDLSAVQEIYDQKKGIIGRVMDLKRGEYIPDMHTDPTCIPTLPQMISQMVIPLVSQERFLGLISLETKKPERFNREKLEFIELVTARIAVSIDNAYLYDLLKNRLVEVEELLEKVSQLEEMKTEMIRIAAHDLNNPLGTIQGNLQLLEMDAAKNHFDPDKVQQYLSAMEASVEHMNRITTDILKLEEAESAEMPTELLNFTQIVRDVSDQQRHSARAKKLHYTVDLPTGETQVRGNRTQLYEATANLINNAIKYTPEGGSVDVILENDGIAAVFEVIDTGYGIPYDMQQKLFQPFYRAKTKETSEIEGTGLGLHLVKRIIERHQGRMIFRSRYQEGSTFGFQVPATQENDE